MRTTVKTANYLTAPLSSELRALILSVNRYMLVHVRVHLYRLLVLHVNPVKYYYIST